MLHRYYQLLGVSPSASEDDIKKAYRKKVILVHPDRNPSPRAHQDFIELTAAYDWVINQKKGGVYVPTEVFVKEDDEEYKKKTYYHGSKFTIYEMEQAWKATSKRVQDEYERYMKLPWHHPQKIDRVIFGVINWFLVLILMIPLLLVGLVALFSGHILGGLFALVIGAYLSKIIYDAFKK